MGRVGTCDGCRSHIASAAGILVGFRLWISLLAHHTIMVGQAGRHRYESAFGASRLDATLIILRALHGRFYEYAVGMFWHSER